MKLPLSWLKKLLPTKLSTQEIADTLTIVGLEVDGIEQIAGDEVFEIALTPNLAHCASVRGVARELAAVTQETLAPSEKVAVTRSGTTDVTVLIENAEGCPRYACQEISGVKVGPSPKWLEERLEQCGIRSVNNVVDVTNLVMMELGHPLHAFDLETIAEKKIVVRNTKKGEKLTTLDEKEHVPSEEMLMICDGKGPIAIAGVMGTAHTEVSEKTTSVLLEAAYFEPTHVRRAASRLDVRTEASYRFERGVNPGGVREALEKATSLICELTGGEATGEAIDIEKQTFTPKRVSCREAQVNRILGTQLAGGEIETIFTRLGLNVCGNKEGVIEVEVPTYRHDVHAEIDLIEEVARLYGFDNIQTGETALYRTGKLPHAPEYVFERKLRETLRGSGLQELLTCDLISPEHTDVVAPDCMPSRSVVKLLNPHSEAQSVLRPSLLPGLLRVVKLNEDHGTQTVAGFELGRLHFKGKERYFEPTVASIVLAGERSALHWEGKSATYDFYDLKGIVENLLSSLKCESPCFTTSSYENFHPGRQAVVSVGEIELGIVGEVHPKTLKAMDLDRPVYFAELNVEDLARITTSDVRMTPLPQYPASSRDSTLTVDEEVEVGTLLSSIEKMGAKLLESVMVLDVYRSKNLGSNRKNVTLRFVYRDQEKTLSVDAIDKTHRRITEQLNEDLS